MDTDLPRRQFSQHGGCEVKRYRRASYIAVFFIFAAVALYGQDKTTVDTYGNWNIQTHYSGTNLVSVSAWTEAPTKETVFVVMHDNDLHVYIDWNRKITTKSSITVVTQMDDFVDVRPWFVYEGYATFPPEASSFYALLLDGHDLTLTAGKYKAVFSVSGLAEAISHSPEFIAYFKGSPVGK